MTTKVLNIPDPNGATPEILRMDWTFQWRVLLAGGRPNAKTDPRHAIPRSCAIGESRVLSDGPILRFLRKHFR